MARRAKRYDDRKLNYKKIFAVIVLFVVIIMSVVGIKRLLTTGMTSTGKITATNYFPVYSNEKWGIIDSKGNIVIEPQYAEMPIIPNNSQAVFICTYDVNYETGTYKTKAVNEKNKDIITEYDNVNFIDYINEEGKISYVQNVLVAEKDGKFGLVDLKGKKILELEYDEISVLDGVDSSLIIKKDDNIGLCDYEGNIIIGTEYKQIKPIGNTYKNGYITVNKDGLYGVIDFNKVVILQNKYLDIKPIYSSGKYAVKIDEGYKVIDKNESVLADKSFQDVKDIIDNNIIFKENGKYGITNINLENKVEPKYEDITYMGNNHYIVKNNGKYGIIDVNNQVQLDLKYSSIENQNASGIVIAKNEQDQYDIYDSTITLRLVVDEIEIYSEYMQVLIDGKYKYYNFKFEEKESKTLYANNDIIADEKDGKFGFVTSNGENIVEYKYDDVTELNKYGYAGIKKGDLWGAVDSKGKVVIEPTYNLDKNEIIDFIGKWHKGVGADYYTDA